jgi:hypothetical protein
MMRHENLFGSEGIMCYYSERMIDLLVGVSLSLYENEFIETPVL